MIKDIIYNFIQKWQNKQELYTKKGKVESVNDNSILIIPNDGSAKIDVELTTIGNETEGIMLIPAVGSVVRIAYESPTQAYLVSCSQIEQIKINGGNNGGLINISEITEKINGLVSEIKDMKSYLNTHIHSGVTTGSGISGSPGSPFTGSFSDFEKDSYEDTKIIH